jgi:hypothetical protein
MSGVQFGRKLNNNNNNSFLYSAFHKCLNALVSIDIAHFTNVSMRFTTSGGLFRAAYYGA